MSVNVIKSLKCYILRLMAPYNFVFCSAFQESVQRFRHRPIHVDEPDTESKRKLTSLKSLR